MFPVLGSALLFYLTVIPSWLAKADRRWQRADVLFSRRSDECLKLCLLSISSAASLCLGSAQQADPDSQRNGPAGEQHAGGGAAGLEAAAAGGLHRGSPPQWAGPAPELVRLLAFVSRENTGCTQLWRHSAGESPSGQSASSPRVDGRLAGAAL